MRSGNGVILQSDSICWFCVDKLTVNVYFYLKLPLGSAVLQVLLAVYLFVRLSKIYFMSSLRESETTTCFTFISVGLTEAFSKKCTE